MKSEADIIEVTVMEVFRGEKSVVVFILVQSRFLTDFLFYGRNTKINNIQDYHLYRQHVNSLHHFKYYYIYMHFLYLINNHLVFYMWGFILNIYVI